MESKNKPMTASEWVRDATVHYSGSGIYDMMEAYAKYVQSFVPPDIEKAIEEEYLYKNAISNLEYRHNEVVDKERESARFGYSLSSAQIGNENKLKQISEAVRTTIAIENPQGFKFCMEKIKEILTIN